MSELLRQTPPVASDVVGAVSALAAFHSLNLLFAPVGCLAAVRAALDGFYFKNPLYAAQMEELDAVMGMEGHFLVWAGRLIRRHPEIEFVALIGAPIPTVSGVNLKRIAVRLERDYGLPVLCIEATGFGSCYWGMHLVWDTLGKRFLKKTPGEQDGSVNILGASRFILGDDWGLAEIKSALGQCGISLECVFEQCGTLSALSNSTKASCNLVMSHESLGIAQYMWEVFNIPYIVRFPAGRHGMRCLLMELSQHIDCAVPRSLLELYEIPWDRKDGRKIIVGTAPAGVRQACRIASGKTLAFNRLRRWESHQKSDVSVCGITHILRSFPLPKALLK